MPRTTLIGPDVDTPDHVTVPEDGTALRWTLVATVVLVTAIAPLATDLYVPAFPRVADDLGGTATQVQLTLTTFFAGMALGQLVGGPVSDRRGRRGPLLAGLVVLSAASVVCAMTPDGKAARAALPYSASRRDWRIAVGFKCWLLGKYCIYVNLPVGNLGKKLNVS